MRSKKKKMLSCVKEGISLCNHIHTHSKKDTLQKVGGNKKNVAIVGYLSSGGGRRTY